MRINGFRCDACLKEHLLKIDHARSAFFGEGLPSEWLILGRPGAEEPLLFCSEKCLLHHAQEISGVKS